MTNILYTTQDLKRKVDLVVNNNKSAITSLLLEVYRAYESYRKSWLTAEDDWAKERVKNEDLKKQLDELVCKNYDLEVQLSRERNKRENAINRCPEVLPEYRKYLLSDE